MPDDLRTRLARYLAPHAFAAPITVRVDDGPGWAPLGTQLDRDWAELYQLQTDALLAWRTNPLARRIIDLGTDYVVGDGITLASDYRPLQSFINAFWNHPNNQLDLRLPEMAAELARAGELFPALHHDPAGMSYVRFIPASEIDRIEWQPGDYETELQYHQRTPNLEGHWWTAPAHPDARKSSSLLLHYAINRPIGCTRGESDLASIMVWLRRYSGWLEDRARLNWAARVFLWFVTVPTNQIADKRTQYASTPEPGSVIVKDAGETWEMQTPNLQGRDAASDGRQLRYMIGAGSGIPLHMLGEGENTNLATAQAMQGPVMRQYRRRQLYFCHILKDITVTAYNHWIEFPAASRKRATHEMLKANAPEIDEEDNAALAVAARDIVAMLAALRNELRLSGIEPPEALNQKTMELAFRFAGEILTPDEIKALLAGKPYTPPQPPADQRPKTDDQGPKTDDQ
jgi:hypothetical protein